MPALCGVDLQVAHGEFVALMGPLGAGKSTLCFALNGAIPHAIAGEFAGQVSILGQDTRDIAMGDLSGRVGLVFEDVEAQLFSASVADEVAFGLEAIGLSAAKIEKQIDESLRLVGLDGFRQRSPRTLSGGEQKRLALASVLAMRPQVLVLDEPTLGLDPRARRTVLEAINNLRLAHGRDMTVVMATQDAESVARFAERVIVLRQGQVALMGSPGEVFSQVEHMQQWGIQVPQLAQLACLLRRRTGRQISFLQPGEAADALADMAFPVEPPGKASLAIQPVVMSEPQPLPDAKVPVSTEAPLIDLRQLSFSYPGSVQYALQGVDLQIARGEWLAIIGVNGSGKSTLLKHLNGLLKPTAGTVHVDGLDTRTRPVGELARMVSYLPQNPDHMIFSATVRQEVAFGPRQLGMQGQALEDRVADTLDLLGLTSYGDHPPAVLGYGLRRQVALASVLAMDAPVLALDEPTVGLDLAITQRLMDIALARHRHGTAVVMITHDLQWVAQYAERVAILYQGHLVAWGPVRQVLTDIEQLIAVDMEPLPVTALGSTLGWPPPLPLLPTDVIVRMPQ